MTDARTARLAVKLWNAQMEIGSKADFELM